jgi:hypothetical protein
MTLPQLKVVDRLPTPTISGVVQATPNATILPPKPQSLRPQFFKKPGDPTVKDENGNYVPLSEYKRQTGQTNVPDNKLDWSFVKEVPETSTAKPSALPRLSSTPQPLTANSTPSSLLNLNNSQPSALDVFKQIPAGLGEASNKIVSGTIRGEQAVAQSLLNTKLGQKMTSGLATKLSPTPSRLETALNQILFQDKTPTITDYGKEILPKFAQKGPLPFIAGLGLTALDFTGAGGEKSALKALTTTTKEAEAFKILKQINVAEDLAKEYAPILAKTFKEAEVSKIISHIDEVQKGTKLVPQTLKTAPETAITLKVDTSISKAKASGQSFDEWVKGQEIRFAEKGTDLSFFKNLKKKYPNVDFDSNIIPANLSKTDILGRPQPEGIRFSEDIKDGLRNLKISPLISSDITLSPTEKLIANDLYKAWEINRITPHGYRKNTLYSQEFFDVRNEYIKKAIKKIQESRPKNIKVYKEWKGSLVTYFEIGNRQISFHGEFGKGIKKINKLHTKWIGVKTKKNPLTMDKKEYENFVSLKKQGEVLPANYIYIGDKITRSHLEAEWDRVGGVKTIEPLKTAVEVGSKERGFITSVKEAKPEFKVAGQYIPRSTDELSIKAANLVKTDLRTAEKLAMTGTDENAVATASELIKHYSDEATKATDQVIKDAFYDKGAEVANMIARKLTEQGRSVQAASILSRLTPEGQLKFAAREIQKYNEGIEATKGGLGALKKKVPELTAEQSQKILTEMNEIGKMVDGTEKAMRFQKLQNYIQDLVPSSLISKITAVWKAGLLTGIKTTGINIFANISHFGSEIIKDIPAKVVDSVASLFTGEKTIGGITTKGVAGGLKEGFQKGLRYLRTGYDERNIAQKLDYNKVNFGKGKIGQAVKTYTDAIFHLLGAEDQPFYYGALARSIADQAKAEAKNAKLSGLEAERFISNLIENPTEKILRYAVNDAETAVFQNKTALGNIAKGIQKLGGGAGEFVVPFGRTPSSVAMQIVNYSPVGIIKTIFENAGKGKFDQRLFSQGLGRGLTGTGVLALGGLLFQKGLINLDRPTGEREQKLWELEGRKANSIKIGDKWRSIQVLGPLGNILLVGGHFKQAFQKSGSPSEAIGSALAGSAKSFSEQTFLTGINQVVSAINDPQRSVTSYAKSMIASIIPTLIGDIARATDTKERRSEKILDSFKAKIPGLRETLQPQINVLGKDIETIGNPLEIMADPTRPQNIITTPVIREFRRLTDAGFPVSPTLLGNKKGYKGLTPEQNTNLWRRAGEITNAKIGSLLGKEKYWNLPDDQKGKVVENVVSKSQINARAEVVLNLIQGLTGEPLKSKLSELKKTGLMTREAYNQVAKMR